jgi:hypothetical protein
MFLLSAEASSRYVQGVRSTLIAPVFCYENRRMSCRSGEHADFNGLGGAKSVAIGRTVPPLSVGASGAVIGGAFGGEKEAGDGRIGSCPRIVPRTHVRVQSRPWQRTGHSGCSGSAAVEGGACRLDYAMETLLETPFAAFGVIGNRVRLPHCRLMPYSVFL